MAEEDTVRVMERTTPYRGYMRLDIYKFRHQVFDRGWSDEVSREVIERGHVVAVLPYDPLRDEVILLEQFRIGAYTAPGMSPWQIECVAGVIEPHQTAEQAALREMEEETGTTVSEIEPIYTYLTSPGFTSESMSMYCGRVDADGVGGVYGLAHEGEYIRVFTATAEEAFRLLDSGRIENGMTIIALLWLRHHRQRLREKWGDTDPEGPLDRPGPAR
jgi:ADP-ribose pyrophosphatase